MFGGGSAPLQRRPLRLPAWRKTKKKKKIQVVGFHGTEGDFVAYSKLLLCVFNHSKQPTSHPSIHPTSQAANHPTLPGTLRPVMPSSVFISLYANDKPLCYTPDNRKDALPLKSPSPSYRTSASASPTRRPPTADGPMDQVNLLLKDKSGWTSKFGGLAAFLSRPKKTTLLR